MLRFLIPVIGSLGLGLILAVTATLHRPLVRMFRAVLIGIVALLAIAGIGLITAGVTNDALWATVVGGAVMLVALRMGWPLIRRRRPIHRRELEHVPLTRSAPDTRWTKFENGLDWVSRQQARQARAAIERFLAERGSESLTVEHRTLLISCEKRVPELVDACLERCRNAKRQERERYMDETLDRLVHLAGEAERARREVREADDQRLKVLHRYFDDVAGPEGKRPPH
jgi:hypothetical protein